MGETELKAQPKPCRSMATTIYSLYYVIQETSFEITLKFVRGLTYGIKEAIYNHTCLTYSFQETFMIVTPWRL